MVRFGVCRGALHALTDTTDDDGQHRDDDDADDEQGEVLADGGQIAEEVAGIDKRDDPQETADEVEGHETLVSHGTHAGDEGGKGPHDGQETGHDDGLAAMLGKESLGLVEMIAAEDPRVWILEQPLTKEVANGVVGQVAEDGGQDQGAGQQVDIQGGTDGQGSRGKQQGVARQERGDHQAGFAEDDQE